MRVTAASGPAKRQQARDQGERHANNRFEVARSAIEAIRAQAPGDDQAEGLTFDLSRVDLEKLRDEFASRVQRRATALADICAVVEKKLARMLRQNPERMDYYRRYQEIVADYNREKDRVTIEETFARLVELANALDEEQRRAVNEGLSEDELAIFDLLQKENLSKAQREKVKNASKDLLATVARLITPLSQWTEKEQTQAEVEVGILDEVFRLLPTPPFTPAEKEAAAARVYLHVRQQCLSGEFPLALAA